MPLDKVREPEKELEPAPVEVIWPEVLREPAVRELVIVADFNTSRDPVKDEEVVVAFIENILEMDATIPDELAISKYASGVLSPSENLPSDLDEKTAKALEAAESS
jgi:hypothetical protein